MTVGVEPCQADLFKGSAFVRERLGAESVFAVLECSDSRIVSGFGWLITQRRCGSMAL